MSDDRPIIRQATDAEQREALERDLPKVLERRRTAAEEPEARWSRPGQRQRGPDFSGWSVADVIEHILSLINAAPAPATEEATGPGPDPPERIWGFCQHCEHTLATCICEVGPY